MNYILKYFYNLFGINFTTNKRKYDDHIDPSNIITTKRIRKKPIMYESYIILDETPSTNKRKYDDNINPSNIIFERRIRKKPLRFVF
jgi:hypothetical protein